MELLIWSALCALIGLGCLAAAVWAVIGGYDTGVERIFLVIVWLVVGGLLLGMAGWIARMGPLRNMGKKAPAEAQQDKEEPAAKTAS
jgi:hypothetical protein